jgi:hypothetical protein
MSSRGICNWFKNRGLEHGAFSLTPNFAKATMGRLPSPQGEGLLLGAVCTSRRGRPQSARPKAFRLLGERARLRGKRVLANQECRYEQDRSKTPKNPRPALTPVLPNALVPTQICSDRFTPCPEGTSENSPRFPTLGRGLEERLSPGGTAERMWPCGFSRPFGTGGPLDTGTQGWKPWAILGSASSTGLLRSPLTCVGSRAPAEGIVWAALARNRYPIGRTGRQAVNPLLGENVRVRGKGVPANRGCAG